MMEMTTRPGRVRDADAEGVGPDRAFRSPQGRRSSIRQVTTWFVVRAPRSTAARSAASERWWRAARNVTV